MKPGFVIILLATSIVLHAQDSTYTAPKSVPGGNPLIVIDDIAYDSAYRAAHPELPKDILRTIKAEDIDNVVVLKNESAIAAYGKQARYGVVQIHMKKKPVPKPDKIQEH